jgi:hypothetical protein
MRRTFRQVMLVTFTAMVLALMPVSALAQHRGGGGSGGGHPSGGGTPPAAGHPSGGGHPGGGYPGGAYPSHGHGTVVVGGYWGGYGYWGYPYWGWGWGWGGPYGPYGYGYPYWGGGYYDNSAEVRLEVKPKEAEVYVDGYYAGIVDDFDGTFQRLRVRPGNHELTLYLKGFKSVKQDVHLGSNQDVKIKYQMQPLAAGESNDPAPQPKPEPPQQQQQQQPYYPGGDDERPMPPSRPSQPRPAQAAPPEAAVEAGQGFGSIIIRVQPSGADVMIDGERWQGPEGAERLVVQVAEGTHRVEVRKEGFTPFSTTIRVRQGETAPLNVSLPPRGE